MFAIYIHFFPKQVTQGLISHCWEYFFFLDWEPLSWLNNFSSRRFCLTPPLEHSLTLYLVKNGFVSHCRKKIFSQKTFIFTGCPRSNFPERNSFHLRTKIFRSQVGKVKMHLKNILFLGKFWILKNFHATNIKSSKIATSNNHGLLV